MGIQRYGGDILQIGAPNPCSEEVFWGGNTLGLVLATLPYGLGYACTFYAPTSPPPKLIDLGCNFVNAKLMFVDI